MTDDVLSRARRVLAQTDPDHALPQCGIRDVIVGPDVLDRIAPAVAGLVPDTADRPEIALVVDPVRIERAGVDVKQSVQDALAQRFSVRLVTVTDGHQELHADEDVIERTTAAVAGCHAVVSVGGGTITDIGKMASIGAGVPVHVVVVTAASVDGFTDDVSVILRNGVKRTVPSRWPDVVIADIGVVAQAPARMNRAGYGEINSMFTAPADWKLAELTGMDTSFHRGPIDILAEVGRGIEEWSGGLGRGDPAAAETLMNALALRGIATGVSGGTACLSGVEHLLSHMLDLWHGQHHEPIGLHGAQVGVASVVAAVVWEKLLQRMASANTDELGAAIDALADGTVRARVEQAFAPADPSGRIGLECWNDASSKLTKVRENRALITGLAQEWSEHTARLRSLGRSAESIAVGLVAAGAPAGFDDLGVDDELARWALAHAALMRNRFTAIDLLDLLGAWTPADVDEVLARARTIVAQARVGASA